MTYYDDITGISFINQYYGWVCTNDGEIYSTENGGQTWSLIIKYQYFFEFNDIQFIDTDFGSVIGQNGIILHRDNYPTVGIVDHPENKIESKLVAYPNPAGKSVTFSFEISKTAFVYLNVYNLAGQLVFHQTYHNLTNGKNTLIWQPKNLTPGLYFCEIDAQFQFLSTKLLLVD